MVFKSRKFAKTLASVVSCSIFSACSSQVSADSRWDVGNIKCYLNDETGNLHIYGRGLVNKNLFDNHPIEEKIKSITIGSYITCLVCHVFSRCKSLESIAMEGDVGVQLNLDIYLLFGKSKNKKFTRNNNKTYITIMHKLIHALRTISFCALEDCTSLNDVKIPNSVTEIESYAFNNCTSLKNVQIPNSVTKIGFCVFRNCTSLKNIDIPNSVTEIASFVFDGCTALKNVKIPKSVTTIGSHAFSGCTSLENIDIPDSVTKIGSGAFHSCISLKNIKISNSVEKISMGTFYECKSLENICIPDSVTEIGNFAFKNCTSLKHVSVPKNAKYADNAFDSNTIVERRAW